MNPIVKAVVAILVAALIVVIGLIAISNNAGNEIPKVEATTAPAIEATAIPEATQQPEATNEPEATDEPVQQAQDGTAQDGMYEGALAGMTEDQIAQLALAEEEGHGTETDD